jgi:undecaprenyl diphosphate synthase
MLKIQNFGNNSLSFSTENWKRSKSEVSFLFSLVSNLFEKYIDELINNRVRVNIVGLKKNIHQKCGRH